MVTRRRYDCDLCGNGITEDTIGANVEMSGNGGIGIYHEAQNTIRATNLASAEHHLCCTCIRGVSSVLNKYPHFKEKDE